MLYKFDIEDRSYMNTAKRKKIIITAAVLALIIISCAVIVLLNKYLGYFEKGNSRNYSVAETESLDDSPLNDKTIIFLGSSVTKGMDAYGESFVDFLAKRDGINALKYAVSGNVWLMTEIKIHILQE